MSAAVEKLKAQRAAELNRVISRIEEGLDAARRGHTSPGLHQIASALAELRALASRATPP